MKRVKTKRAENGRDRGSGEPTPRSFRNSLYLLRISWGLSKGRVLGEFAKAFIRYANWVFYSVVFMRFIVGSLASGRSIRDILVFVGSAMGCFMFMDFFNRWYGSRYAPLSDSKANAELSKRLFEKAASLDLSCYEDSAFYDRFTLAQKEANGRLAANLSALSLSAAAIVASASVIVSVISIDPVVIAFMAFPIVGNFVFAKRYNALAYRRDREMEPFQRRIRYVNRVLYLPEYAKEIRLSRVSRVLGASLEQGAAGIVATAGRHFLPAMAWVFVKDMFSFLFPFQGAFLYGAYLAIVRGSIDVGQFSVVASSVVSASWMFINLSGYIADVVKGGLYGENLRGFFEYENRIADPPDAAEAPPAFESLELRGLSFAYPGGAEKALDGIDVRIERGEKVAFVGHNGAGKTSLVKLLLRLYDPTEGEILLNGRPVRDLKLASYRAIFSTAFQDFRLFSMSVAENVLLREPAGRADYEKAERALALSGALERVRRLPKGLDTVIGREYDEEGAVLSGGESQKVAMARAFARDFSLAIFDEPSSALDPMAEYGLFKSMMETCADKTVIFISHRLSSATLADRVILMEGGRIAESGSHSQLMAKGGKYAAMFAKQAENYVKDNFQSIGEGIA